MSLTIIEEKCTGCKQCEKACFFEQIEVVDKLARVKDGCTLCGACAQACPFEAIIIDRPPLAADHLKDYTGLYVFAEQRLGVLSETALELLGEGRRLAGLLDQPLVAVLLGNEISGLAQTLIDHGADKVFVADNPGLNHYRTESYAAALTAVLAQQKPNSVLFAATTLGRDLAPRVAARLKTGLTADCTALDIEPETGCLLQTRPAWGGNLMAMIKTAHHRPQMATVRPRVMAKAAAQPGRTGEVIKLPVEMDEKSFRVEIGDWAPDKIGGVDLDGVNLIVSGGRGVGDAQGFELLDQLAGLLDGAVGASRAAVDAGWRDHDCQVGQTGRTVAPQVYVACGISGAVQHRVGMENSGLIIAINKNPDAPMMKRADYAVVGDVHQILPELIKRIKARLDEE